MEFLTTNKISHLVEFVDMDDEEQLGPDRLIEICGKDDVPCLIVEMKPIFGEEAIIQWMRDHLLGQSEAARA